MNHNSQAPLYEPPDDKQVEHYARAVCERLALHRNDESIGSSEVINGFAMFLKVILRIEAKRRNDVA